MGGGGDLREERGGMEKLEGRYGYIRERGGEGGERKESGDYLEKEGREKNEEFKKRGERKLGK